MLNLESQQNDSEDIKITFMDNWDHFIKKNFNQRELSEEDVEKYRSAPASAIATHVLEHAW